MRNQWTCRAAYSARTARACAAQRLPKCLQRISNPNQIQKKYSYVCDLSRTTASTLEGGLGRITARRARCRGALHSAGRRFAYANSEQRQPNNDGQRRLVSSRRTEGQQEARAAPAHAQRPGALQVRPPLLRPLLERQGQHRHRRIGGLPRRRAGGRHHLLPEPCCPRPIQFHLLPCL